MQIFIILLINKLSQIYLICLLIINQKYYQLGDTMDDKEKVIEAFKNSEEPLNAKKVSELSGVEKKEVDKIMKELKKDETIVSPKRCYWTLNE